MDQADLAVVHSVGHPGWAILVGPFRFLGAPLSTTPQVPRGSRDLRGLGLQMSTTREDWVWFGHR
jgi:hypothetical protein